MITQISYNVLIERFRAFASGHYLIEAFTHGELSQTDLEKDQRFPWMHVFPVEVEPRQGSRLYTFVVTFADLPRDKETDAEYQRESLSDCIKLAEDLLAEIQNGLVLFGPTVELEGSATIEPFIKEFTHTLTGVNLTLTISVPWNWDACDIPADFAVGGSGSGGSGSGGAGLILETNGVLNGEQTLLNLQEGANITIVDNGFGTVTISGTGGGSDDVATAFNVNHTTATGNQYVIGDRVWYNGNVYQCIANNDALLPTNATYWALIGAGFRLRQTPVDWGATSGDFQVLNKPTIPAAQVNSDWAASSGISQILNKPTIPAAQIQSDWAQANNAALDFIKNKPTIPAAQLPSDWAATTGVTRILNKPTIPVNLNDLGDVNTPSPTNGQVLTWNGTAWVNNTPASGGSVTSVALTVPAAFSVAGSPITTAGTLAISAAGTIAQYIRGNGTLATFPTIPAAQVNSDWNATSGLAEILNKPTIPAAQVNSDWNAVSGLAQVLNKPTIPTTLDSLTNVNVPSPTNAQVLQYDTASSQWIAATPSTVGTVTSVGTTGLISGGPITTSGTITTSMNTSKLVGRYSAGTGIMEEITVGSGLTLTGAGVLNNTATPTPTGYYGAFQDNTTQTAALANIAYAVKLNTTDLTNGVSVVNDGSGNPTQITLANTGIYNIQFSLQLEKTGGGGNFIVDIWIRKNGVDVPNTAGKVVLTGSANASPVVAAWNYVLDLAAGDYVQLMWSTSNNNAIILAATATPPHSGIPSAILTVTQQAGILAGTGITAINSLTGAVQSLVVGTGGTDFAVSSLGTTHTFNLPTASAANRGALSTTDWATFNAKVTGNAAITGATKTKITYDSKGLVTAGADLAASDMPTGIDAANIGAGTVSNTEFGYLDGVTSDIQTQINNRKDTFTLRPFIGTASVADNQNYYFGEQTLSLVTSPTLYDMKLPFNAVLVGATIYAGNLTTNASGELSTLNIRVNNTTDTLLTNQISFAGAPAVSNAITVSGLSVAISASDTFIMKWTTPVWATNPTAAQIIVTLFFERA